MMLSRQLTSVAQACAALTIMVFTVSTGQAQEELLRVTTGSNLERTAAEAAEPIYVLTREQIIQEGYGNAYEALQSLTVTGGAFQGSQNPNGFTVAGQELGMRGLGASRTVVLINGRRIANSPYPLNGFSSYFNLAIIPTAAIEHIEVSTGASSAIYGSEAVTGVINIITNLDFQRDRALANVQLGTTHQGGGESHRLSYLDSVAWHQGHLNFGLQYQESAPIFGSQRIFLNGIEDIPNSNFFPANFAAFRLENDFTVDVPGADKAGVCQDLDGATLRESSIGRFCERNDIGFQTLRNDSRHISAFGNFTQQVGDNRWFGEFMLGQRDAKSRGDRLSTGQLAGPVIEDGVLTYSNFFRSFSDEEIPNQFKDHRDSNWHSVLGVMMPWGENTDVKFSLQASEYDYRETSTQIKEEKAYLFFAQDINRLWRRLYSYEMEGITGESRVDGRSQLLGANALLQSQVSGWLEEDIQFSVLAELYRQDYYLESDERSVLAKREDFGWLQFRGANGGGERDQFSLALEGIVPLVSRKNGSKWVELQGALRYDQYRYNDRVRSSIDKVTHKLGLTWFVDPAFLVRATHSSSFRTPDLHAVFGQSSFIDFVTDELGCRQAYLSLYGELPTEQADNYCLYSDPVFIKRSDATEMRRLDGRSKTIGFVLAPSQHFSLSVDYYAIDFDNTVVDMSSIGALLQQEADCFFEQDLAGNAVDRTSETCDAVAKQVRRFEGNGAFPFLDTIDLIPQPLNLQQSGIDAHASFDYPLLGGRFLVDGYHNTILDSSRVPVNIYNRAGALPSTRYFDSQSRSKLVLAYEFDRWSSAFTLIRNGAIQNYVGDSDLPTWKSLNWSLSYRLPNSRFNLLVNNLGDVEPPRDASQEAWPFFNNSFYSAVGREYFLQVSFDL